jgi:bacteriocin-like protein
MQFTTLSDEELATTSGGVHVQLTQYGYANDPYMDSQTKRGNGAYHKLAANESVGLTSASMHALGLTPAMIRRDHPWVNIQLKGGGVLHRRVDDTGPERNARADLYMPGGLNRKMPDSADISLADGYTPHAVTRRHR